ncbi:MAG: hypothetical protein QM564_13345 [Bergeyella sp.]
MTIERTTNEIIFRLPSDIDILSLQKILNFLKYKNAVKNSKATEKDAENLAEELKENWWKENKKKYIK